MCMYVEAKNQTHLCLKTNHIQTYKIYLDEFARAGSPASLHGPERFCGVRCSTVSSLAITWADRLFRTEMWQAKELTNANQLAL